MNELLKLIESVDPADTAKLDEIDLAVYRYVGQLHKMLPRYTRSRDALKAIRPEGWQFDVGESSWKTNSDMGWHSRACKKADRFDDRIVLDQVAWFKTEELAELHAIIQAIEYERSQP